MHPAAEHNREAFETAESFEDRLASIPQLTLAYFGAGRTGELTDLFDAAAERETPWHRDAFAAEMHTVLGDLEAEYAARRAVYEANSDDVALIDRLWDLAIEIGDDEGILRFSRAMADVSGEHIHVLDHYRVLTRQGEAEMFRDSLEANGETLFSVRELFPELFRNDKLDLLEGLAAEAENAPPDEWRALFALGEWSLFREDRDAARFYFQRVVGLDDEEARETVASAFPRLNRAHFSRYAAMYNLALATDSFGADGNLAYSFLGMPDRFNPESLAQARDGALLYLKHGALEDGDPETFLDDLAGQLAETDLSHGERILAMGIAGAPRYLVDEIEDYLASAPADPGTDRFVLRVVNRHANALEAFPELRDRMIDAVVRVSGRLAEDEASEEAAVRQQMNILNRLGDRDGALRTGQLRFDALAEEGDPEGLWEKLNLAFQIDDVPAAEEIFTTLRESPEGREFIAGDREEGLHLYFANRHLEEGDDESASGYLVDYLRSLDARAGSSGNAFFSALAWWDADYYPPENPFWDGETMEGIYQAVGPFLGEERFYLLAGAIDATADRHPPRDRGNLRFLESCFMWWRGDPMGARIALTQAARETGDPYVQYLSAFVSARDQRVEQANAMLAHLDEDRSSAFQRAALRFLMARETDDAPAMAEAAGNLVQGDPSDREKIGWATELLERDFIDEAGALLAGVAPDDLGFQTRDPFREALFVYLRQSGRPDRGAALARTSLMMELPESSFGIGTPMRREALNLLEAAGELPSYRQWLESARELAPNAYFVALLQAEAAPYGTHAAGREGQRERLREAMEFRTGDFEQRLEYARWLQRNEYAEDAVAVYDVLLREDAPEILVFSDYLIQGYEAAGALDQLAAFFRPWEVPQARSMDDFYGLQPTNHFLEPLGERLRQAGQTGHAIEVWTRGVGINPIHFTEGMRLRLMETLREEGNDDEAHALLADYLFRENPSPEMWVVQPFFSVVPRWLNAGRINGSRVEAPVLDMVDALGGPESLIPLAEQWRDEDGNRISRHGFLLVVLALARDEALLDQIDAFAERQPESFEGRYGRTYETILHWLEALLVDWPEAAAARERVDAIRQSVDSR